MNFYELPDIDFVDIDVKKAEDEITRELSNNLDKKIYKSSPERIMALTLLQLTLQQSALTNDVGKQNLLKFSRGDYLEALGAFWDEYRKEEQRAHCIVKFTMSTELSYTNVIPANTRVKTSDGRVFYTVEHSEVAPGEKEKEIVVYAEEKGIGGNGVVPGQINTLIDVFPYFQSVTNITESTGGMYEEDDEHFREKIHEAPEKLSTAGPEGAYTYWAKSVDINIGDVKVYSPSPGVVEIVPLYSNGDIPSKEVLDKILNDGITRKRRPLTDKVQVKAPSIRKYNIEVKYWINEIDKISTESIKAKVESAVGKYIYWQKTRLGRDINPSKLIAEMIAAGAKRVEIISPKYTILNNTEVAYVDTKKIEYQGLEEE